MKQLYGMLQEDAEAINEKRLLAGLELIEFEILGNEYAKLLTPERA